MVNTKESVKEVKEEFFEEIESMLPTLPIQAGHLPKKIKEELQQIEARIKKHAGKAPIIANLEEQKKVLLEQLHLIEQLPDMAEYLKKMNETLEKLIPISEKKSKLEKAYIDLIEK